jgi:hypothetical protein
VSNRRCGSGGTRVVHRRAVSGIAAGSGAIASSSEASRSTHRAQSVLCGRALTFANHASGRSCRRVHALTSHNAARASYSQPKMQFGPRHGRPLVRGPGALGDSHYEAHCRCYFGPDLQEGVCTEDV